jgi:hypothetical protein
MGADGATTEAGKVLDDELDVEGGSNICHRSGSGYSCGVVRTFMTVRTSDANGTPMTDQTQSFRVLSMTFFLEVLKIT